MNTRTVWAVMVTLLIASPLALAQAPLAARALLFDGASTFSGDAAGLLAVAGSEGFSWEVTADSARVERLWVEYATFDPPGPVGAFTFFDGQNEKRESNDYAGVRLVMTTFEVGGAILVLGPQLEGATNAPVSLTPVHDPALEQNPERQVDTKPNSDGSPNYLLRQVLRGDFVNLTTSAGDFNVAGDIEIRLYGGSYHLSSGEQQVDGKTGRVSETTAGPAERGRIEVQSITLKNAAFELRSLSPTTWMTPHARVAFEGALVATDETSPLDLPTLRASSPGQYSGSAMLNLSPSARGLELSSPALMSAEVTRAPESPRALTFVVLALGIIAIAVGLVAWRARTARADDLELAVLAMEERRWERAITHLDRLATTQPNDAAVLMDRAICHEEVGRLGEARKDYERALRVTPHNAEAHYYYARTLARLQMTTSSMAHLSRALALDERLAELARRESAFFAFADHPQFLGLVNR